MLTLEGCRARQDRFRERLGEEGIHAVALSDHRDIYYLTGVLLSDFPALLFLETEGGSWLAAHTEEGEGVVDDRFTYEWHTLYTLNPDLLGQLNVAVSDRLQGHAPVSRIGWQEEGLPKLLADTLADRLRPSGWAKVDGLLAELQKSKDPDEVALLRKCIEANLAAYTRAQEVIAPGVNELDVLAEAQHAATLSAGEIVYHGGDYRCGEFGGPARNRKIEAGELYIIDAQTKYRGYWSDLSRTFVVGGEPTKLQVSIYTYLADILTDIPNLISPGGRGTELWKTVDARIREHPQLREAGLIHHAGHGVGVRVHEAPDLNRDREAVLAAGDVFSCEPGAYCDGLKAGIRIENTFRITDTGVDTLSEYPLSLVPTAT